MNTEDKNSPKVIHIDSFWALKIKTPMKNTHQEQKY